MVVDCEGSHFYARLRLGDKTYEVYNDLTGVVKTEPEIQAFMTDLNLRETQFKFGTPDSMLPEKPKQETTAEVKPTVRKGGFKKKNHR